MSAASTAEPAFVAKTKAGRVTDFVDSRVGGSGILREFGRKVFPDHWSFMFGEVALYSFVILLLSGTFLTFFFDPSMAETHYDGSYVPLKGVEMSVAYSSSLDISFDIRGGLFMRQVHHWAALLFVASIAVHMLRVFFTGAFRKPREMNWVVGSVLLILAMAAGFTGYSLPDDLLSGNGLRIIDGVIKSIPVVGTYISFFLFGGEFPGTAIISRLYMLHILLVPALILLMIVLHLFMVVVHKHTQYPGPGRNDNNVVGYPLGPVYAAKAGGFFFIVFGVLALMAGFFTINPIWNYGPYDPSPVSAGTQPDWYIGFVDGALRLMPGVIGGLPLRVRHLRLHADAERPAPGPGAGRHPVHRDVHVPVDRTLDHQGRPRAPRPGPSPQRPDPYGHRHGRLRLVLRDVGRCRFRPHRHALPRVPERCDVLAAHTVLHRPDHRVHRDQACGPGAPAQGPRDRTARPRNRTHRPAPAR